MKVYFFPPSSPFNPYIENIVNGLEKNSITVVNKKATNRITKLLSSFTAMAKHTDIYHFNWIENKSSVDTPKNRLICWAILLWIGMMKRSGGKIAWTMHNKESHFCEGDKSFHYGFMKKFVAQMDMIMIHAKETADVLVQDYHYPDEKICYVPHGSYITNQNAKMPVVERHEGLNFLAFGMVNRYKNIPLLIQAFRELRLENATLRIVGKCASKDQELLAQIEKEVEFTEHVTFENRFIPDEEVDEIFRQGDIVVLPYDKQSMINSGVAIKALSEGKPIITSLFGAIRDIQDRDFVYSYDYSDEFSHLQNLKTAIRECYEVWKKDKHILIRQGNEAYRYASIELSWDVICASIVKKYKEILDAGA